MRLALPILCALAGSAAADVELKNDSFAEGAQVAFQGGFAAEEIGAAQFVAPEAGRQLLKVQLLFGGDTTTKPVTLIVYDDTADTVDPGTPLYQGDFELMGSTSAIHELTPELAVTLPARFRVGIQVLHAGAPSIAADADMQQTGKNFIFAKAGASGQWIKSSTAGVKGDWVIRAFVSGDPAPVSTPCTTNPDCPTGQFCDTDVGECTMECAIDSDCAGGSCNSLGQCIGTDPADDGGCCSSSSHPAASLFGAGLFALLLRRRRAR